MTEQLLTSTQAMKWLADHGYEISSHKFCGLIRLGGGPAWMAVGRYQKFTVEALRVWVAKQQAKAAAAKESKPRCRLQKLAYGVHTYERVGKPEKIRKTLIAQFNDRDEARDCISEGYGRVLVMSPAAIKQEMRQ